MNKINIVIADPNGRRLKKLVDYMSGETDVFNVYPFTSIESFNSHIADKQNKTDIVALAEEFSNLMTSRTRAVIILLADKKNIGQTCVALNKNQKPERLANAILKIFAEKTGRSVVIAG